MAIVSEFPIVYDYEDKFLWQIKMLLHLNSSNLLSLPCNWTIFSCYFTLSYIFCFFFICLKRRLNHKGWGPMCHQEQCASSDSESVGFSFSFLPGLILKLQAITNTSTRVHLTDGGFGGYVNHKN